METEITEAHLLPQRHILSVHPEEYLHQGLAHCGAYAVKGVLSAYGKDTKGNPLDYNEFWLGKTFGQMMPRQMVHILQENGLSVRLDDASGQSQDEKINLLKEKLRSGTPIILVTGNGYDKKGRYWRSFGAISKHYVSLWGYDDENKEFYTYDPCVKEENRDNVIPIGNIARTYDATIRDWNYGWAPHLGRNVFITAAPKEE